MAFSSTLGITVNAVLKTLNKINQDNYGSEYYLRETTQEFRAKIRHSVESAANGAEPFERHNLEITQTIFATATDPERIIQVYSVFRVRKSESAVVANYLCDALSGLMASGTVTEDILAWMS